jgi:hypothetical protein
MIKRILPTYYFSLECLFLYFLLFIFYIREGEIPSIYSFLTITAVANLVLLYSFKQEKVSATLPFIGAIISGGVGYLLGLSLVSVILITIFLYFRTVTFIKDTSLWLGEKTQFAIVFYGSGLIIFFFGAILKYPHMNWLFGIVIAYTLLLTLGRYLQQVVGNNGARNIPVITAILGIAVAFSGIVLLIIPIVKFLVINFWEGVALSIALLTIPIFKLVETITLTVRRKKGWGEGDIDPAEFSKEKTDIIDTANNLANLPPWALSILLALILITIWFFVRKKRIEPSNTASLEFKRTPSATSTVKKGIFFREPAPNDYLRKLFYQLQIYSEKYGFGRFEHETMREWFERVGFQKNEELFLAYDLVRYGGKVIHKHEAKFLEEIIRNLKRDMKEKIKKEKDKEA